MARKTYKPEEIVAKLRQVDVLVTQGRPVAEAVRSIGVKQDSLGIGEFGHDLGPLSTAARNAWPCTDRRPGT